MALAGEIADPGQYATDVRKLIRRARRVTNKTSITAEVEVLRLDGVPVKAEHLIMIEVSHYRLTAVAAEVTGRLKISTAGTATTASTGLRASLYASTAAAAACFPAWYAPYTPSADETLSILLTLASSSSISMTGADADLPLDILVWDMGLDTGDVGTTL